MSIAIDSRFGAVSKLVAAAQAKGLDPEIASYYCKLGAVMICGAVERSVEILVTERVGARSVPQVGSFLKSFFKRGTNYDCDAILELLYKFDSNWGHGFKAFISDNDQVKSGISSCYAIRNSVAHGGTQSLGPSSLKQYYKNAVDLIAGLEKALRA